jgi:hypothetical protein
MVEISDIMVNILFKTVLMTMTSGQARISGSKTTMLPKDIFSG